MTASDGEPTAAGVSWLKWSTIVGGGAPIVFGAFFGNHLEAIGISTPGLEWGFWVQSLAFLYGGAIVGAYLAALYVLLVRDSPRFAGVGAVVGGLVLLGAGVLYPLTFWWLAGPLAVIGGGKALLAAGDADENAGEPA